MFASSNKPETLRTLFNIFNDDRIFPRILPEPDWANVPLTRSDLREYNYSDPIGKEGELPEFSDKIGMGLYFPSTGHQDDRWYSWRLANWGTKWDAYDIQILTEQGDQDLEVAFNTAWSPPEGIVAALRIQYPDLSLSWFYDEPGCEIAGYL